MHLTFVLADFYYDFDVSTTEGCKLQLYARAVRACVTNCMVVECLGQPRTLLDEDALFIVAQKQLNWKKKIFLMVAVIGLYKYKSEYGCG